MGASDTADYDLAGSMLGGRVLLSGNVPTNLDGGTNEARTIAADMRDMFLYEYPSAPVFIRAQQPERGQPRHPLRRVLVSGAGSRPGSQSDLRDLRYRSASC